MAFLALKDPGVGMPGRLNKIISSRGAYYAARLILGGIFVLASVDKIAFPSQFSQIVRSYNILPAAYVDIFAYVLPYVELALGIILIVGSAVRKVTLFLLGLLILFAIAIIAKDINGGIENCGCLFFSKKTGPESIYVLLIRNGILFTFGIFILWYDRQTKVRAKGK